MHDEAGQAVLVGDHVELTFPEVDRVVMQDVEQGIVLDGRDRELEDPPDEERHYATAATTLRIQVRDARHRHIVGEVKRVVPGLVAIESSRAKPECAEFLAVLIDALHPAEEDVMPLKEAPVMIEVVDVDLESPMTGASFRG